MTEWKKGQSGNPKGRPPKSRALTAILEKGGSKTVEYKGKRISGKRLISQLIWELAETGQIELDGRTIKVGSVKEWADIVKWIYSHIDGPPKAELDITSAGEKLGIEYINDWRDYSPVPPQGTDNSKTTIEEV